MKPTKRILTAAALVLALLLPAACAPQKGSDTSGKAASEAVSTYTEREGVFIRVDRDDPDAWKQPLANVRYLTAGEYTLTPLRDDLTPSLEGFDTLNISGSAQFSTEQFGGLADKLKSFGKTVTIVDTRLESHGLINDIAVSWCGEKNGANLGMTTEEVEADEASLAAVVGSKITAYTAVSDAPDAAVEMDAQSWKTERELVTDAGFQYLRLICPDHCWPPADVIDAFIGFAKDLDMENAWLHFHCQAGKGRTGAFMTIYDMMKNPDVAVEDILLRQAMTGSGNLYDRSSAESSHSQKERCVMARAIYRYLRDNRADGYRVTWSQWLEQHTETLTLHVGDAQPVKDSFSSDLLVIDDSFKAVGAGEATVLAGDTLYRVTVEE